MLALTTLTLMVTTSLPCALVLVAVLVTARLGSITVTEPAVMAPVVAPVAKFALAE